MSLDTNNESLTANELARRTMDDCDKDARFRAAVKSKKISNKDLAELFPGKAIARYYPFHVTNEQTKSHKTKVVSRALDTVRKRLEAEDNLKNFVAAGRPHQGPTSSSDAQVCQVSNVNLVDNNYVKSHTDVKSNHNSSSEAVRSLDTECKKRKHGTNDDDEVECVEDTETRRCLLRRSLRVLCENWLAVHESTMSEETKNGIRNLMLNDMTSNQNLSLSPDLLELVKNLVKGGGTVDAKEEGDKSWTCILM